VTPPGAAPARLVVNADDCGYLPAVTRGIVAGIDAGAITATGLLANGPCFEQAAALLNRGRGVDCGVHLNLTWGAPLTAKMAAALARSGGRFPPPARLALAVLAGDIDLALVAEEWRVQIARARDAGLAIAFLNTHQHVHLLPPLHRVPVGLAAREQVRWVRWLRPDAAPIRTPAAFGRRLALATLGAAFGGETQRQVSQLGTPIPCVGFASSGRLGVGDLVRLAGRLAPGSRTELMCHPGYDDPTAPPPLRRYHRWESELAALCSVEFRAACARHNVDLVGFSALTADETMQVPSLARR
jgi:predicted glycoside hydrolase/deacetylase ChbG (UPF0249 family)